MYAKSKLIICLSAIFLLFILLPNNNLSASDPCGDLNFDEVSDIEDLVMMVNYVFFVVPPDYLKLYIVDLDNDGVYDIGDLVYMVDYMFRGGSSPDCPPYITENPSSCLSSSFISKSEGLIKSAQTDCLPYAVDSSSFKIKWYGEFISIEHYGLRAQCCLKFAMFSNITYSGDQIIVDVYEKDTAAYHCFCICDFNVSGMIPVPMFYEPTNYVVNLYSFDEELLITDTVLVGGPGELETKVEGNALAIWYHNAFYNCCPGFYTEYEFDGQNITLTWHDSLGLCDCICYYDLESTIEYLPDGEYIVTLLNDGYRNNGDTVGVDTVLIGGEGPYLYEGSNSGCLNFKSSSSEYFEFEYNNGTLTYNHFNTTYNCAFVLDFSMVVDGNTLRFYEKNISPDAATCLCEYNINQIIKNVEPGIYQIEVYSQDVGSPQPALIYRQEHTF